MRSMTLNDGTFIYNSTSLREYLSSLGFDLEDLIDALCEEKIKEIYDEGYDDCWHEDEIKIDGCYCAARDLATGVEDICDDFRHKYKSAAILKILDTIDKFIQENRID